MIVDRKDVIGQARQGVGADVGKRGERLTSSSEYFLVSGKKRYTDGKITNPFKAAKRAYVPHRMFANIGPVAMTT